MTGRAVGKRAGGGRPFPDFLDCGRVDVEKKQKIGRKLARKKMYLPIIVAKKRLRSKAFARVRFPGAQQPVYTCV
jgi:hypothetical protein